MLTRSIEGHLFKCEYWDYAGNRNWKYFKNCEFITDFGPCKNGDKFEFIYIDYERCIMNLWKTASSMNDEDPPDYSLKIRLCIEGEI